MPSLSMQDLAAVIEAMRRDAAERAAGAERRTTQRINIQLPVEGVPLSGLDAGRVTQVITIDVGAETIGFYCTSRVAVGDHFMLMLPHAQRNRMVALYSLSRATEVTDGLHHVGGKLIAQSPAGILRAIKGNEDPRLAPLRIGLERMAGGSNGSPAGDGAAANGGTASPAPPQTMTAGAAAASR